MHLKRLAERNKPSLLNQSSFHQCRFNPLLSSHVYDIINPKAKSDYVLGPYDFGHEPYPLKFPRGTYTT